MQSYSQQVRDAVIRYLPLIFDRLGYVAPRNLPSAGFFPFLQTLMCNTDTSCSNRSRLVSRHYQRHHGHRVARDTGDDEDYQR